MAFTDEEKDLFTSLGVQFDPTGETIIPPNQDPPPADPPGQDPPATDPPATGDPNEPDQQDPYQNEPPGDDPNKPGEPPATPQVPDKANQAFAAMRTENSQLKKAVEGLANLLGITDIKDTASLTDAVKNKVLEAQAAKDKIPVEYLKKLDHLENIENQFTQEQLRSKATLGFQQVISTFSLDQTKLNAFVDELTEAGVNPLLQPVDLVNEYRTRHFDDLIKAAEEKGRTAEAQRAAKAGEHSSTPGTLNGGKPEGQDKITSINQLDALLDKK